MNAKIEILNKSHWNIGDNASNQIRRQIGKFSTIVTGHNFGTVQTEDGCFDWWLNEENEVEILKAL